jgi:transposase
MANTLSVDLRKRILKAYDRDVWTREEVAQRFEVSLGVVKKLLAQRKHTGDIRPRHYRSGRKPGVAASHRRELRALVNEKPDLTLRELREKLALACTLPAIHFVLAKIGLTYKKKRSALANKTAPTSPGRGAPGAAAKAASIRRGSSSSTKRVPRPI